MAEDNPLKKKVQDDIVSKLCNSTTPHMKVEPIITEHIAAAVAAPGASKQDTITQASYGAISGMALMEKNLPESASRILKAAADAATRIGADPTETMMWAMEGIAKLTPGLQPNDVSAIAAAIDADYHGAGQAFHDMCVKARGT